jgi:hypothetical protein
MGAINTLFIIPLSWLAGSLKKRGESANFSSSKKREKH